MKDIDEMRELYEDYIETQTRGYEFSLGIIGFAIEKMQERKLISPDVKITGRIKSFKSAYSNYEKNKKIDDCFGMRIIADDGNLKKIREELNKVLTVSSTKDHGKITNTNYNAIHQMAHINNEYADAVKTIQRDLIPLIEIQYWNKETEQQCFSGNLSYAHYKHRDLDAIIQKYKENPDGMFDELPVYYEIEGSTVKQLTKEETLIKLYPEIREMMSRVNLKKDEKQKTEKVELVEQR